MPIETKSGPTPGPWKAVREPEVHFGGGWFVAQRIGSTKAVELLHPSRGYTEADAHLIAAAPDLLAVCRDLVSAMKGNVSINEASGIWGTLGLQAEAAIAKAEGR